jgi:hypothetical protein
MRRGETIEPDQARAASPGLGTMFQTFMREPVRCRECKQGNTLILRPWVAAAVAVASAHSLLQDLGGEIDAPGAAQLLDRRCRHVAVDGSNAANAFLHFNDSDSEMLMKSFRSKI